MTFYLDNTMENIQKVMLNFNNSYSNEVLNSELLLQDLNRQIAVIIKGKHHRIFCDPAYANSKEYKEFWEKRNKGEFQSGQFKRFAKGSFKPPITPCLT